MPTEQINKDHIMYLNKTMIYNFTNISCFFQNNFYIEFGIFPER